MKTQNLNLKKTYKKVLTKRGVLWLGQTCNLRCQFCYFIDRISSMNHPEHPFMSLEKAKKICKTLADCYGNNAVDIQGGEPTIFKDIFELIRYCNEIKLAPTLITNGLILDNIDMCKKFKKAGVRDFIVSVHGIGKTYDEIVGVNNAHIRQMKALKNLKDLDVPIRFNCVLTKNVLPELEEIAKIAIEYNTHVVNFIAFNPFEDQAKQERRSSVNVPKYRDVTISLTKALDMLEQAGIETNVRYFPICMVEKRHRKNIYNFQQLPYDLYEWDYASWSWTGMREQRMRDGDTSAVIPLEKATAKPLKSSKSINYLTDQTKKLLNPYPKLLSTAEKINRSIIYFFQNKEDYGSDLNHLYRLNAKLRAEFHCKYEYSIKCDQCIAKAICDGFHGDYAKIFGNDEANPILGENKIDDPVYYISQQEKVVDEKN